MGKRNYENVNQEEKVYNSLLKTLMNEVKGIRNTELDITKPCFNLLDMDIPTMELAVDIPDYKKYVEDMIHAYDRYLGYSSNITFTQIEKVFKYGINLFTLMKCIFRYYQANELKLPTGETLQGIYEYCTNVIISGSSVNHFTVSRIDSTVKGVSNKLWETDFISKVEKVLLPQQVITFYNYYLGSLFNVSDDNSKEKLTFVRIWPSIEEASFITYPMSGSTIMPKISKSMFESAFTNLETYLTPKVREFICGFLGWVKPNMDWTRPITGDVCYTVNDDKFVSTFNLLFPEKVDCYWNIEEDKPDVKVKNLSNAWARYYYDFEIIGDSTNNEEFIATKYYFGIDGVNTEQYTMAQNNELDSIVIDFNNYILLCVLTSEEISGSKAKYVGGIWSLMSKVNTLTGLFESTNHNLDQIYMGNDLKFNLYDFHYDLDAADGVASRITDYTGFIGDVTEVCEYSENLKIFNYPINIPEVWNIAWRTTDASDFNELFITAIVNGDLTKYDPSLNSYSSDEKTAIDHTSDEVVFDTYIMTPNEVHLAVNTVLFSYISGFTSYNEAITFIDNYFRDKQQVTE